MLKKQSKTARKKSTKLFVGYYTDDQTLEAPKSAPLLFYDNSTRLPCTIPAWSAFLRCWKYVSSECEWNLKPIFIHGNWMHHKHFHRKKIRTKNRLVEFADTELTSALIYVLGLTHRSTHITSTTLFRYRAAVLGPGVLSI